jgi:DNA polymerase
LDPKAQQAYLRAMGIPLFRARNRPAPAPAAAGPAGEPAAPVAPAEGSDPAAALEALRAEVAECTACPLHEGRTQTVFGVGDPHASVMFVGEAPGAEEDRLGEPFVGRAGKLLDAMLAAIGLDRQAGGVFIANVLKCRPPNNRDPEPTEVAQCEGYLRRQIELVAPDVLVALGRVAAQELTRSQQPLAKLRGREHAFHDTPLLITYHPAYLLRSPADKAKAWADLKAVRRRIRPA